jgi:DNA-directed RNA polymerase specialized sigma24 family protein
MIGDAIVKMFSALKRKKYDVNSETSPFSYFTTIAFHAFINRIKKEKKHHDAITAYRDQKYEELLTSGEINVYIKPMIESEGDCGYNDDSE